MPLGAVAASPGPVDVRTPRGLVPHRGYAARVTTRSRPSPDAQPERDPQTARAVAAVVCLVEGLVLVGFAIFYVVEIVAGATDSVVRATTSGSLILLFGAGLIVLSVGWRRGAAWPRTPTLLWNALLLPVAWSLHDSGRTLLAIGVAVLAVVGIGAALNAASAGAADAVEPSD